MASFKFKINHNFLKVLSVNIFIMVILLEVMARFYFVRTSKEIYGRVRSEEIDDYLEYVNHARNIRSSKKGTYINGPKPKNIDRNSFYVYSKFSECLDLDKCNTVLLQGDSWGRGLEKYTGDIIFTPFMQDGWKVLGMGTSSFSPSNFSGQLGYLANKSIKPDIVISFIDQTDLGDEYFRYRNQLVSPTMRDPFYRVKPFNAQTHWMYYNYNLEIDPFSLKPLSPLVLKRMRVKLMMRIVDKIDSPERRKLEKLPLLFPSTPRFFQITSLLKRPSTAANLHFKEVIYNYLLSANKLGVKEIYLVTHPHFRHQIDGPSNYQVNVSTLIDDVLKDKWDKTLPMKVFHIDIIPKNKTCIEYDSTCGGYYRRGDQSSHPIPTSYRKISNSIIKFINKNSSIFP